MIPRAAMFTALLLLAPPGHAAPWHAAMPEKEPANEKAAKVLTTIALIENKLESTKYQHKTYVHLGKGIFNWDCSGMAGWVLGRAAPKARKQLPEKHPLAKQFYKAIEKSPSDGTSKKGWARVPGPTQVAPGDLFAWLTPDWWVGNPNSGHVGFILTTPQPHPAHENVWLMLVADASKYRHENDSRPPGGDGGFGTGNIAFLVDDDGAGLAYGWHGSKQPLETYLPTTIIFGRVTK